MAYGKLIELFLVNGTADSLITAELSNWNGKAIKVPRIEISACNRLDITQAGVYFLFCKEDDGTDSVYIGESENIKERLIQHIKEYQNEKEKYYWNTAVLFIGDGLNKALIRYLENRFVEMARKCKRYKVLTKKTYRKTVMKESQIAVMGEFIDNVKILINALGYKVLEPLIQDVCNESQINGEEFIINSSSLQATGRLTSEGFVILKDSVISKEAKSSLSNAIDKKRKELIDEGIINKETFTFTQDYLFSSPSFAAGIIKGCSTNGKIAWKNSKGQTLNDIEKLKA